MSLLVIALILWAVTYWTWKELATARTYRVAQWQRGWQEVDTIRASSYYAARKQAERKWSGQLRITEEIT